MLNETEHDAHTFSADALEEWARHVEGMLRGVGHSLNNRAAAVAAVMELSGEQDDDPAATRSILDTEFKRLQELSRAVRIIGAARSGTEALVPADLVSDVLAALQLHAELRNRQIVIEAAAAPPVRVPRWTLVRALIALAATAASEEGGPRPTAIDLRDDGSGDWLVVTAGSATAGARSRYADEMARAMGGEPLGDARGFRIPTLAAVRRREGR